MFVGQNNILSKSQTLFMGFVFGNMGVLVNRGAIIGTGCYDSNHITGVYALPDYQKQGCGSKIMDCLETEISKKYDTTIK